MKKLLILILMLCSLILVSCGGKKDSGNVADIKTPDVLPTPAPVKPETDAEKQENFAESLESFNGLDSSKLDSLLPTQRPEVVIPELNLGEFSIPTSKMEVYASQGDQEVKMMDGYLWQVEDVIYAGMSMGMGETSMNQVAKVDLGELSTGLNEYLKAMEEMVSNAPQAKPSELINQVLSEVGLTLDDVLSLLHFEAEDFEYEGNSKFVLKNEALARVVANAVNAFNPESGMSAQMLLAMLQQLGIELEISFTYANQHITNVAVSVKGNIVVPGEAEQQNTIKIDVKFEVELIYGETELLGLGLGLDASVIGDKAAGQTLAVSCDFAVSLNGLTLEADIETGKALKSIDAKAALVLTEEKIVVALDAKVEELLNVEFKLSADKEKFSLALDLNAVNRTGFGYWDENNEWVEEVVEIPVKVKANAELTKSKVNAQLVVDGKEMLKVSGTLENNWFKKIDVKVLNITREWDEENNTEIEFESTMVIKLTSVGVTVPQDLLDMQEQAFDVVPVIFEKLGSLNPEIQ